MDTDATLVRIRFGPRRRSRAASSATPTHVVTPLCLFERCASLLEVASIHPGVSLAVLQQATGWPVGAAPETPLPTPPELATLARLDPENVRAAEF